MLHLALLIAAFVLFTVATFVSTPRFNLVSAGLALFALSFLILR